MRTTTDFGAPWGRCLRIVTPAACLVLACVAVAGLLAWTSHDALWLFGMVGAPMIVLVIGSLFSIRGYRVEAGRLRVLRPGWHSTVRLEGLVGVEADPEAMAGSIRVCGNGGLFCFAGWFWNQKLGSYRAFVTDPARSVVLRFPGRAVVVTPDDPGRFVSAVQASARTP